MTDLFSILLLTIITVLLLTLATTLYGCSERNRLQKTLILICLVWAAMLIAISAEVICTHNSGQLTNGGVFNFHYIWMGLIGLLTLFCYPAMALHRQIVHKTYSLLWVAPLGLTLLGYIGWHIATGTPMNYRYATYNELWDNLFTVPVILRLVLVGLFATYLLLALNNLRKLTSLYEKYSEENYSDNVHNTGWLRLISAAIGWICAAYFAVLIWDCPATKLGYAVVVCVFFTILTISAFSRKIFTKNECFETRWSRRKGWQLIQRQQPDNERANYPALERRLEEWMLRERRFLNPDFTASDVYAALPELSPPVLANLLARRKLVFQSYVRALRIEEARRMLEASPQLLCKEVAFSVGFSSSQAFSRAFFTVTGKTPMEFRKNESQET